MKPFIAPATRSKCSGCGGLQFVKKKNREFQNEIPSCLKCGERPELFRVAFSIPKIGGSGFKKIFKTTDQLGRKLDSASRADAFCEHVKDLIFKSGNDFDPRSIGTKDERDFFLIKNCTKSYLSFHKKRVSKIGDNQLTPAGFAKKERICRLYLIPIFGEFTVKELTYRTINAILTKSDLSDSVKCEVIKELGPFFKWACMEGLILSIPELPKKPKSKRFVADDFYSIKERNLVIGNIKKRKIKIMIMILANYARRKSEVMCLRWGDVNFKTKEITFSRHISDGKGIIETKELAGLKSSPDKVLRYDFFPGLYEMLMEMTPSLNPSELIFKNKDGDYIGKNVLYDNWKKSALELIEKGSLKKFVDIHRGTRSSSISALHQIGISDEVLVELYGGDIKTMKDFYAKKNKQILGDVLINSVHLIK